MSDHTEHTDGDEWPEEHEADEEADEVDEDDLEYVWDGPPIKDDFGTEIDYEDPISGRTCFYAYYFAGAGRVEHEDCTIDLYGACGGADVYEFVEWANGNYPGTIGRASCVEGTDNGENGFEVYTYNPKLTSEQFDEIVDEYNRMKEAEEEAEFDADDEEEAEEEQGEAESNEVGSGA